MELALYAPGLGYYSAGSAKLGAGGDFVTAPEVSAVRPLHRAAVRGGAAARRAASSSWAPAAARWPRRCCTALAGAGRAARALRDPRGERRPARAPAAARSRALPAALAERVRWLDRLPRAALRGVMLANEVADALPFRRIRARRRCWLGSSASRSTPAAACSRERAACSRRGAAGRAAADCSVGAAVALPDGYTSEVCPRLASGSSALAATLGRGAVLLSSTTASAAASCTTPQRSDGTLRCHYRHRAHDDPFLYPRPAGHHRTGWTSRALPRRPATRGSTWPAIARRPRSSAGGSGTNWRSGGRAAAQQAAQRPPGKRSGCCCRARWARPSRRWLLTRARR